jgi:hypothetical protein
MKVDTLNRRLRDLEGIACAGDHDLRIGLMKRMKIYEQIYEGTADLDDPQVQECVKRTTLHKRYFDELEAGVVAPGWP